MQGIYYLSIVSHGQAIIIALRKTATQTAVSVQTTPQS